MKITPKDTDLFIGNVPKNINAILLYGADSGLATIRTKIISKSYNMVGKFKYELIKNNVASLLDSIHAIKLFGDDLSKENIAIVEFSGVSLAEPLLTIVKNSSYKGMLLFYAGELGTDSSLRKAFETSPNLAAVPCYLDDQVSLIKLIQQTLKSYNLTYETGVLQLLLSCLPYGDRVLAVNELEKILLFLGDKKYISILDLQAYLQIQGEVSFDKLCYQLSLHEVDEVEVLLLKLLNQGHNLVQIIRMVIYHFNRLHQVKALIENGKSQQQAISSLFPPVFFKQTVNFNKSLKLWTKDQLMQMLMKLTDTELSAKKSSNSSLLLFKQMISLLKIS